jgi:hypothetical protein
LKGIPAAYGGVAPLPTGGGAPLGDLVIVLSLFFLLMPLIVVAMR